MNKVPIVYTIFGPTACGKSVLAIAIASVVGGEIISADSMQIYKKLDIGTAKVSKIEQEKIVHHLIDIKDVTDTYSVSDFVKDAKIKIEDIVSRNKVPIIVGGTGLYITALVNNMSFNEEEENPVIDERISEIENTLGVTGLYDYLLTIDKEAAINIENNNAQRIKRAIKMSLIGNKKSELVKSQSLWEKNSDVPYKYFLINLDLPREELYNRINKRVDEMVKSGLIDEAKYVKSLDLPDTATSVKAIGYKEFFDYLDGNNTLEASIDMLKQNTRHYAKRQLTWFNKLGNDITVDTRLTKEEQVRLVLEKKEEMYGEKDKA